MPKVVLTFDYELFLGLNSGTAEHSILRPTQEIIRLLKKHNAKAIFFVDTTYLLALKRFNHSDFGKIIQQLKEIVKIGSSVELHLHPQWIDAVPKDDRWEFLSFEHYRLHSLDKDEIEELFDKSIQLLQDEIGVSPIAFRAGGWSIMPFCKLKKSFLKYGIKIDMSVLSKFFKDEQPMHYYDFRHVPDKPFYRFEDDVTKEDGNGALLEIPVTTLEMNGVDLALNTLINKFNKEEYYGDGQGLASSNIKGNIFKRVFQKNLRKATIENQSNYMFKKSLKKIRKQALLSYVMHPKTLHPAALKNFEYLVENFETLNSDDVVKEFM